MPTTPTSSYRDPDGRDPDGRAADRDDGSAASPATADPATADTAPGGTDTGPPAAAARADGQADNAASAGSATRFVFVDTEATGLDHARHELTEVAWIVRFKDGTQLERQYFPEHTTDGADADALELTHYAERIAPQPKTPARVWLTTFLEDARGAVLVGAVPDFDARHLDRMCHKLGVEPTWDHHLLDVETLALPLISPGPEAPRSLAKTCAALGIAHDKDQAHGALYDARQAMHAFDRIWELLAELRRGSHPLPPAVPRNGGDRPEDPTPEDPQPVSGGDGPEDPTPEDPQPVSGNDATVS